MKQSPTFSTTVCGIPCGVVVHSVLVVPPWKGSAHTCPSADDYYGYEEVEWSLLDRKGYPAPWLEKKMTDSDRNELEIEILEQTHE